MTTTQPLSPSLRKAAVLLRSLDADSSAVLLASLSSDEARAVRQAIRELGDIDPLEQQQLCDALRPSSLTPSDLDDLGVELNFSSAATAEPDQIQPLDTYTIPTERPAAEKTPFGWLDKADLPTLAAMLEREHLSTVAVVLSRLPAERASHVLAALPPNRRAAALERLADLGDSDEASIEVIENELADWIATQNAARQRRADRLAAIQAILRHSPAKTCSDVMSEIARHDQQLASEIGPIHNPKHASPTRSNPGYEIGLQASSLKPEISRPTRRPDPVKPRPTAKPVAPPTFPFERLIELNRDQLAELFRHCPSEIVVLAIAGASPQLAQHVQRLLPRKVAHELRRRMHSLSSVTLSDMSRAQQRIAHAASGMFGPR